MNRRSYLQVLTTGLLGSAGCIETPSIGQDQSSRVDRENEYAFVSYDSDDYQNIFEFENERSDVTIVESPSRDGDVLRVNIPEGAHRGMRMRFWMDDHFDSEPEEATATYWLYVPQDFEFANSQSGGGKLPGFQGTYGECGAGDLGPCDGSDGWSARMGFERPEAVFLDTDFGLSFYVYHGNMMSEFGSHLLWNRGLKFDTWHRIDQYVSMNTPGENDGVLRGWIDGELSFDRGGFFFREEGQNDIRIEEFNNTVYFGGEWASPVDNVMYFDDLEIRTGEFDPSGE